MNDDLLTFSVHSFASVKDIKTLNLFKITISLLVIRVYSNENFFFVWHIHLMHISWRKFRFISMAFGKKTKFLFIFVCGTLMEMVSTN